MDLPTKHERLAENLWAHGIIDKNPTPALQGAALHTEVMRLARLWYGGFVPEETMARARETAREQANERQAAGGGTARSARRRRAERRARAAMEED